MQTLTLPRFTRAQGEIALPGSKSLSNRLLLLAALAEGETELHNLLDSDDVRHMLAALAALGVRVVNAEGVWKVAGLGGPFVSSADLHLFLGNAGTAVRPLTAALACSTVTAELTGEPRMYERPIGDLLAALRSLGADITCSGHEGFLPLTIRGQRLRGGRVAVKGDVSSQFLTALLMAAPLLDGDLIIDVTGELVSKPYIDITLHTMAEFGVQVGNNDYQTLTIAGGQQYSSPGAVTVEGDASSASYFLAAGALGGGPVRVTGAGRKSVQGDVKFAEVLAQMGAQVTWGDYWIEVAGGRLRGVDVDLNHIPDAAMTLATTALFAEGPTAIRNVYNWRVKETDRLAAMACELRKVGARVEEGHDYLHITPPAATQSAAIDTYNDHRMAMCFALAAFGEGTITINDPGCVSKTFPTFFEVLAGVTGSGRNQA